MLGHEAVGVVRELGLGVTADALGQPLRIGDPISWMSNIPCRTCFYCTTGNQPSLCESRRVYGINQTSAQCRTGPAAGPSEATSSRDPR